LVAGGADARGWPGASSAPRRLPGGSLTASRRGVAPFDQGFAVHHERTVLELIAAIQARGTPESSRVVRRLFDRDTVAAPSRSKLVCHHRLSRNGAVRVSRMILSG